MSFKTDMAEHWSWFSTLCNRFNLKQWTRCKHFSSVQWVVLTLHTPCPFTEQFLSLSTVLHIDCRVTWLCAVLARWASLTFILVLLPPVTFYKIGCQQCNFRKVVEIMHVHLLMYKSLMFFYFWKQIGLNFGNFIYWWSHHPCKQLQC